MMEQEIYSLGTMQEINGSSYRLYDHVFHVIGGMEPSLDSLKAISALLSPNFDVFDGVVLNVDFGAVDKFTALRASGNSNEEAQYWVNLLPISDLLEYVRGEEERDAIILLILGNWNRIIRGLNNNGAVAHVVYGGDADEVYVTVSTLI